MNRRVLSRWFMSFALATLLLSACGAEAPSKTRAGAWKATTDCGDFTLFVSDGGTAITNANYKVKKFDVGPLGQNATSKPWNEPFAFDGRKLSMHTSRMGIVIVGWEATFSRNGRQLSGTVHFLPSEVKGGCKARFSINR